MFLIRKKMSNNSQPSENGETESLSIVGSDEVARQGKEEEEVGADDNSVISVNSVPSSLISGGDGSQSGTDTASEADVDDQPDNDEPIIIDDEEETASQINAEAENQGRAISNLVLFSIILFTVPLSAMYITYRFIFIDHFHFAHDQAVLYAGLVAALLVYIILGLFAWIAYRDESAMAKQKQQIEEGKKME